MSQQQERRMNWYLGQPEVPGPTIGAMGELAPRPAVGAAGTGAAVPATKPTFPSAAVVNATCGIAT